MTKKLYRSSNDKMISGVCAGIGEYFDLDATLVRLAFVLLTLAYGGGVIAYIVCAIVVPERPSNEPYVSKVKEYEGNESEEDQEAKQKKTKKILGFGLLAVGFLLLSENLFWWFDRNIIWAIAIIVIGGVLLLKPSNNN